MFVKTFRLNIVCPNWVYLLEKCSLWYAHLKAFGNISYNKDRDAMIEWHLQVQNEIALSDVEHDF